MKFSYWPKFKISRPRSIFARGLLMIIMPVALLQILMSGLIIQRHFDMTTAQLTAHAIKELQFAENQSENFAEFIQILEEFDIEYVPEPLIESQRRIFDLSGYFILQNFQTVYQDEVLIDTVSRSSVLLRVFYQDRPITIKFSRAQLTAFNPHQVLLNSFAFSIVLLMISLLFLRRQAKSMRELAQAASAFGRNLPFDYRPTGALEVRQAGQSFLAMSRRITRQREQRSIMLSGFSHDLRSPLTRMRLEVEIETKGELQQNLLKDIDDMQDLVEGFLQYARNDAVEPVEITDIVALIRSILSDFDEVDGAIFPYEGEPVSIPVKPNFLRRAIVNILQNARQYSQNFQIALINKEDFVEIFIDDDGPGIAASERENALKAFVRLDHSRNQNEGAHSGLGLAIAEDILRQHGGQIQLDDSPLGGLRVTLILPKR